MKKLGILLLSAAFVSFAFTSCEQLLGDYAKKSSLAVQSPVCLTCHTDAGTKSGVLTGTPATMQTAWKTSGHALGMRVTNYTGAYAQEWLIESSASCTKCHTGEGFASWVDNGRGAVAITQTSTSSSTGLISLGTTFDAYNNTSIAMTDATADEARIDCFACHDPHSEFAMGLRTTRPVGMPGSNMSAPGAPSDMNTLVAFNKGKGNLCAACHSSRRTPATLENNFSSAVGNGTAFAAATAKNIGSSTAPMWVVSAAALQTIKGGTPHPSIQADALLGINSAASAITGVKNYAGSTGGNTYGTTFTSGYTAPAAFTTSPHYSSVADACVTCHFQLNSHAAYNTTSAGDKVSICVACHTADATGKIASGTVASTKVFTTGATTFDGAITGSTLLADIKAAKLTLLTYFGDPANFYSPDLATTGADGLTSAKAYNLVKASTGSSGAVQAVSATTGAKVSGKYTPTATTMTFDKDWMAGTSYYFATQAQAQAFWNLMFVEYDKSQGVHNPKYSAQLLYDAINLLALTLPSTWTARP